MVDTVTERRRSRLPIRRPRPSAGPENPKARRRKRRIRIAGTVAGIALLGTAALMTSMRSPMPISAIEVTGASPELTPAVLSALGVEVGQAFGSVDSSQAEARVDSIDGVQGVKLQWTWWDTLAVRVTEQVPAGAVARDGSFLVVDAAGDTIRKVAARPAGLPLIEGVGVAREAALLVARELPSDAIPGIDAIVAAGPHGVSLRLVAGPVIILGEPQDVADKFRLAQQLAATGAKTINVSVPERPALKDLPAPPKS